MTRAIASFRRRCWPLVDLYLGILTGKYKDSFDQNTIFSMLTVKIVVLEYRQLDSLKMCMLQASFHNIYIPTL